MSQPTPNLSSQPDGRSFVWRRNEQGRRTKRYLGCTDAPETRRRSQAFVAELLSDAVQTDPVQPGPLRDLIGAFRELGPTVRDMVLLYALTDCRPAELVQMRFCDIDRSGSVRLTIRAVVTSRVALAHTSSTTSETFPERDLQALAKVVESVE